MKGICGMNWSEKGQTAPMGRLLVCLVGLWIGLGQTTLAAQTVLQARPGDDLAGMIAQAAPGTIIELAGGEYGELTLRRSGGAAGQPITLRSASDERARLERLSLREVEHLVLDGLVFDYRFAPEDVPHLRPFQIFASRGITIRNALFDGDIMTIGDPADSGYPTAFGLSVQASAGIEIENTEIRDFYRGLVVNDVVNLRVIGNDLHSIRMDGMNFAQVERVWIENNTIRDFKRAVTSADHADMIQFWTNGTERPSRDVVIRGNLLNSGLGWYTQSIFMRNDLVDRGIAGPEMFYRNFVIEENVIINAHLHGITMGEAEGVTIRRNTLIFNPRSAGARPDRTVWRPRIAVASTARDVTITDNIASSVPDAASHPAWRIEGNLLAQDTRFGAPDHYDALFVAALTGDPRDLSNFRYRDDGPLATGQVGASKLAGSSLGAAHRADGLAIQIRQVPGQPDTFEFQAAPGSALGPKAALAFTWDLGDGTILQGESVRHSYAVTDEYKVVLRATTPAGQVAEQTSTIRARSPVVLRYDQGQTGQVISYADGVPTAIDTPADTIRFGGIFPAYRVPNAAIRQLFGADNFELRLRLRSDGGHRGAGELLRIHPFLIVTTEPRGSLDVRFTTQDAAELRFRTGPTPLLLGDWVDLTLRYSSAERSFTVLADGQHVGGGATTGAVPRMDSWGLDFGNAFNARPSMAGEIGAIELRVNTQ